MISHASSSLIQRAVYSDVRPENVLLSSTPWRIESVNPLFEHTMADGKCESEINVMAEQEDIECTKTAQTGEFQKTLEDVEDIVQGAIHDSSEMNERKISILTRLCVLALRQRLPSKFTSADAVNWMRQDGPWRGFLVATVGIACFTALAVVVTFALLLLSSTLHAAIASMVMAISIACFFMAFFFSSVTVMYVGALGFGGLTIGSIAFFSVWAVIFLSGWVAITWVIWQGLRKGFQLLTRLVVLAGSVLPSVPATKRLRFFQIKFSIKGLVLLESERVSTD